jgi:peptide deformylase
MDLQYKLIPFDDAMLSSPVQYIDIENKQEFAERLENACKFFKGIGLSANQVGINNRVFCVAYEGFNETFFDPKIVEYSKEETLFEEGCLSQPGVFINLKRPKAIRIEYTNKNNERVTTDFGGITARIIQHEYDHMEGTNFIKRASPLKQALALKKANAKKRRY